MEVTKVQPKEKTGVRFSIDIKKAKPLFESVFKTINHSTVLPILEDILVSRCDGNISYSTTDLETMMMVNIPDYGKPDFNCIFPGVELKYLIRNSIANTLEISLSGETNRPDISIKSGGFGLRLVSEMVDTYPRPIEIETPKSVTIDVKEIIPYLEKALIFVSNDDLRPAMTGICFSDRAGFLTIAATDAHRLYWWPICKTPKEYKGYSFIVSAKAARIMIAAFRSEKDLTIEFSNPHLCVRCENKTLTTRLIDARYPDYGAIIPTDNRLSFDLKRADFFSFLQMCLPFTNSSTNQLSIIVYPDRLDLKGGDIDFSTDFDYSISIYNPNMDTFSPFKFGVNAKFLIQALQCVKGEYVNVKHSMNPLKAIVVDECVLMMPLMLNE